MLVILLMLSKVRQSRLQCTKTVRTSFASCRWLVQVSLLRRKDLNEKQTKADKVWVIGVDDPKSADGDIKATDGASNFVDVSSRRGIGTV